MNILIYRPDENVEFSHKGIIMIIFLRFLYLLALIMIVLGVSLSTPGSSSFLEVLTKLDRITFHSLILISILGLSLSEININKKMGKKDFISKLIFVTFILMVIYFIYFSTVGSPIRARN